MVLYFYTLPTVASAYIYGRRHATLTAFASVLLVVLLDEPGVFGKEAPATPATTVAGPGGVGRHPLVTGYLDGVRSTSTRTSSCRSFARPTTAC